MNFVRQFLALLRISLEGEGARIGSVLTILVGVTCTVAVLVSMLAMGTGAHRQATGDVRDDEVVIQTKGARVVQSNISRDEAVAVRDLPGYRHGQRTGSCRSTTRCWLRSRGAGAAPADACSSRSSGCSDPELRRAGPPHRGTHVPARPARARRQQLLRAPVRRVRAGSQARSARHRLDHRRALRPGGEPAVRRPHRRRDSDDRLRPQQLQSDQRASQVPSDFEAFAAPSRPTRTSSSKPSASATRWRSSSSGSTGSSTS